MLGEGTARRIASLWFTGDVWRRRLIFWGGGLVVGSSAAVFALLSDAAQVVFVRLAERFPDAPLIVTPLGMALSMWLTLRWFPGAQGSGIPQAAAAREFTDPEIRRRLVSIRIAVGKVLLTLLGLVCGASVGREGPTVQVGASLMHLVGKSFGGRHSGLLLAGGAAGVAAAFNTPLAGIVFAIEEMGRSFQVRSSVLIIAAVAVSGAAALAIQGDYLYFGQTTVRFTRAVDWVLVPIVGVLCGATGGLFSRVVVGLSRGRGGRIGAALRAHPVAVAGGCGLVIAILGLFTDGRVHGTGYLQARELLEGGALHGDFGPAKWVATLLSSISGIPGGIFSPSLAAGAGLGADAGALIPGASIPAAALLGMVAHFAGVTQAPITAFVIVMEMTGGHAAAPAIMIAGLIGTGTARLIGAEPIYHALARNLVRAENARARPAP